MRIEYSTQDNFTTLKTLSLSLPPELTKMPFVSATHPQPADDAVDQELLNLKEEVKVQVHKFFEALDEAMGNDKDGIPRIPAWVFIEAARVERQSMLVITAMVEEGLIPEDETVNAFLVTKAGIWREHMMKKLDERKNNNQLGDN